MPPQGFEYIRNWDAERVEKGWWHSFELPDGPLIEGVCSLAGLKNRFGAVSHPRRSEAANAFSISAAGMAGSASKWNAAARKSWPSTAGIIPRFRQMHAAYGSRVDYRQFDMYDLTPQRVGRFDIVLFMGVLYHLKHPLLALERVCALTTDLAVVESFILREGQHPPEQLLRRPSWSSTRPTRWAAKPIIGSAPVCRPCWECAGWRDSPAWNSARCSISAAVWPATGGGRSRKAPVRRRSSIQRPALKDFGLNFSSEPRRLRFHLVRFAAGRQL